MSQFDPEFRLRRLTQTVLVCCLGLVLATAALVASSRLRQTFGFAHGSPAYRVGAPIDTPRETYAGASYTLILFARAGCAACQGAQPFLSDVIAQLAGSRVGVSVVTPLERREGQAEYVRGLGLNETRLFPLTIRDLKVRVVPTAVLVDQRGVILSVSEGAGDSLRALSSQVLARAH